MGGKGRADAVRCQLVGQHRQAPGQGREPRQAGTPNESWRPRPWPRCTRQRRRGDPLRRQGADCRPLLWGGRVRRLRLLPSRPAPDQQGPAPIRTDPEGPARQHRPSHHLRGVRLAFDAALSQVARNSDGPLAEEFTRVLKEIQIGSSRSVALRGPRPSEPTSTTFGSS